MHDREKGITGAKAELEHFSGVGKELDLNQEEVKQIGQ